MPGRALIVLPAVGQRLTLAAVAAAADVHPDLVARFVAYGLLEPVSGAAPEPCFDVAAVRRLCAIQRLRTDLGINLPGIAVVLDLLERIDSLQRLVKNIGLGQGGHRGKYPERDR